MNSDAQRLARASSYVLGMMQDAERERAELDLAVDDQFRAAVMQVAERMHLFDVPGGDDDSKGWQAVAARLAELPQMRTLPVHAPPVAAATSVPAANGRRGLVIAMATAVVAVLAFLAGRWSAGW
ncbi:MAG: hypothetical protein AB7I52_18080 [Rhizobiaceae bacterium]